MINIDSYHNSSYVDILGESGEMAYLQAQTRIRQRMIICINRSAPYSPDPLQTPSWENMNCTLYAANIAKALLVIMHDPIKAIMLDNVLEQCALYPRKKSLLAPISFEHEIACDSQRMINLLGEELLKQNIYLKKNDKEEVIRNSEIINQYHIAIRKNIYDEIISFPSEKKDNIRISLAKYAIGSSIGFSLFLIFFPYLKSYFYQSLGLQLD